MSIKRSILRATDANLRTDNWQYILEVCDLVRDDPEDGGEEAIQVIEERLEQKDANVILRTLSLIVSLAENCGSRLKQLISSKHFTKELYSLIDSKSVHITVKREIAKVVKQLSASFKDDPSLRYMGDMLSKIALKHPHLMDGDQPNVPSKKEMSAESKLKEDKDLEQALKLSLVEFEQQKISQTNASTVDDGKTRQTERDSTQQSLPTASAVPTVVRKVRAMYDLTSTEPDELSFKKGDVIVVLEQVYRDWWRGTLCGKVGIFPLNYVSPIEEPSPQELELEKMKENELLAQKSNVDQLYYTLQNSKNSNIGDVTQNPAINELYGSVTPLRPQVAKTIGKYARKREDLASLRQVLANAEATYNQLLDRATSTYTSPVSTQYYANLNDQGQYYGSFAGEPPQPQSQQIRREALGRINQPPQAEYPPQQSYGNYGPTYGQTQIQPNAQFQPQRLSHEPIAGQYVEQYPGQRTNQFQRQKEGQIYVPSDSPTH